MRSRRATGPLALLLAGWLAACAADPKLPPVQPEVDSLGPRAATILAAAIRQRTVNPPGDEKSLALFYAGLLAGAGVKARVIDTPSGTSRIGRAAAWGLLPGTDGRPPIVLLSHLDVVPADARHWDHDPFAGIVDDGVVIGRGALDAKGVSVVHLLTMIELARRGTPLRRDLVFLATPDEESGGLDGAGHLVREHPDLLSGARYLLTEGGSILRRGADETPIWGVAVTEKSPCWLRVVASGSPGHSSVPAQDAAVPRLVAALERLRRMEMPLEVVPEVSRMFEALAPLASREDRAGFRSLERALARDPGFRSRFLSDRGQGALVRNTVTITVLQGSPRTNVISAEAVAHLDARLLPGQSCVVFGDTIRRVLADPGIRVEQLLSLPSRSSSTDTALFRAIEAVAERTEPGALVVPRVIAGFTDAHYFRDAGLTAYGFVPRWHSQGEARGIHGANERITVENLRRGILTLIEILQELDRID